MKLEEMRARYRREQAIGKAAHKEHFAALASKAKRTLQRMGFTEQDGWILEIYKDYVLLSHPELPRPLQIWKSRYGDLRDSPRIHPDNPDDMKWGRGWTTPSQILLALESWQHSDWEYPEGW